MSDKQSTGINTSVTPRAYERKEKLLKEGYYPSLGSLLTEAINDLYEEKMARIELHPKAKSIVRKVQKARDDDIKAENLASKMIINHAKEHQNNGKS